MTVRSRSDPMGSLLRADASDSVRSWTIWWGRYLWPVWGNLLHSVRTGESNWESLAGTAGDGFAGRDAEAAGVFNHAMVELTRLVSGEVVRAYDFFGMKRIIDIGGGYGELLAAILEVDPKIQGILFDLPQAIEGARKRLEEAGQVDRFELVAGSFFDSVPGGGDIYLLKSVLHDWPDDRSAVILRNCRRAMPEHARLLIVERIMSARMEPSPAHQVMAWSDLNMLVVLGGRERTEAEFRGLLASSGFKVARILSTALGFSVVEAFPS
jgi:SAM-dependent methyltransferase